MQRTGRRTGTRDIGVASRRHEEPAGTGGTRTDQGDQIGVRRRTEPRGAGGLQTVDEDIGGLDRIGETPHPVGQRHGGGWIGHHGQPHRNTELIDGRDVHSVIAAPEVSQFDISEGQARPFRINHGGIAAARALVVGHIGETEPKRAADRVGDVKHAVRPVDVGPRGQRIEVCRDTVAHLLDPIGHKVNIVGKGIRARVDLHDLHFVIGHAGVVADPHLQRLKRDKVERDSVGWTRNSGHCVAHHQPQRDVGGHDSGGVSQLSDARCLVHSRGDGVGNDRIGRVLRDNDNIAVGGGDIGEAAQVGRLLVGRKDIGNARGTVGEIGHVGRRRHNHSDIVAVAPPRVLVGQKHRHGVGAGFFREERQIDAPRVGGVVIGTNNDI